MQSFEQQSQIKKIISKLNLLINYKQVINPIDGFINSHHSSTMIQIKDQQVYTENQQYLKRIYQLHQYHNKMILLCEYYKFHHQLPRVHIKSVYQIMEENYQQKIQLQFKAVTNKIKQQQTLLEDFEVNTSSSVTHSTILEGLDVSYNYYFLNKQKCPIDKLLLSFENKSNAHEKEKYNNYKISSQRQMRRQKVIHKIILQSNSVERFFISNLSRNFNENKLQTNSENIFSLINQQNSEKSVNYKKQGLVIGKKIKIKLNQQLEKCNRKQIILSSTSLISNHNQFNKISNGMFWKLKQTRQR